jgi:capsular exopolysaccharide synthesis family protein
MIPGLKKRVFNLHDVFMYVALVRKHARLMALLLCFTLLVGIVYNIYARPVYYARSLVHMDYTALPLDSAKLFPGEDRLRVVRKELLSPHIAERVARRFGIKSSAREITRTTVLRTAVWLNSEKNLEVEVFATSRDLSSQWGQVMVEEYESYRREKHQRAKEEIYEAFTREINDAYAYMGKALQRKFDVKSESDAVRAIIDLQSVQSYPAEIVRMNKRIDDMGRVKMQLEDPSLDLVAKLSLINKLEKDPQFSTGYGLKPGDEVQLPAQGVEGGDNKPAGGGGQSIIVVPALAPAATMWQELDKEQQRLRNEIREKSATYLSGHRVMQALQGELEQVQKKLQAEYDVAKRRFDLEYQDLINRRAELNAKLGDYERITQAGEAARQTMNIASMSRLNWERMISDMKKKIEALDFAWEKERVDLTFIKLLEDRKRPVSPNRGKIALLSLAFGLALAIGVPFLIEYLDHTIHSLDEVESTFQLRGLGIVPKLEGHESPALIDRTGLKETSLVENFRVIRTNLLSMGSITKEPRVIMVTSAMPKEGKTVVSSNLAISFAHNGARTLLVDIDLRRGRMHRLFGYRKSPGLSNVLLGEVTLEEACRPTNQENLHILSAGKHLDTGTELLGSEKFAQIMETLREKYDRVVVDTPPVLGLSDTSVVQKLMDGVLFVIWSGRTPIRNMKAAVEMLQGNGANFYGFILNRLDLSATQNYYQYYYYSHDYYYSYTPQAIERS